ncbi:tetratricopeptide repeat protein, partial [Fulvivirga sp. RKSG066]|uniref:tetratricopeptide repeat-containing sensor histidine kinase n=1 Tax=Fulvivirga aurantia TaxID=2529383 RepID=UPI0012BC9D01
MKTVKILLFILLAHCGTLTAQSSDPVDSLKSLIKNSSGSNKVDQLHLLIINTWLNQPDTAMSYAREAIRLADSLNDTPLISKSIRLKGGVHYYQADFDSALFYAKEALNIALQTQDTSLISNSINNAGLAYYNLGSYQNALENLLRALNLKILDGEIYGRAQVINNLGLVYDKLKDYKRAREYFNEALAFAEKHDDPNQKLYSLNNLGNTYLSEGKDDKALKYFNRAINLKVDNKNWNAVSLSGVAQVYMRKGNFDSAGIYFDRALRLRQEIGDKIGLSEIYFYYAKEAQIQDSYDSVLSYLGRSQQIATSIGAKDRMLENIKLYVDLYQELGDIEKAFEYQTMLLQLNDTLFNENMARNLAEIQLEMQQEEAKALLQEKDAQITDNKKFTAFLITIIVLVGVILIVIFVALRHNQKVSEVLKTQNYEIGEQKEEIMQQKESLINKNLALENAQQTIQEQNKKLEIYNQQLLKAVDQRTQELEERNKQLKLANLELDNFIYKSSHDIKGPLASLMGVCNVALMDIEDEKSRKYFEMLGDTAKGLYDILARLKTVSDISSHELKAEKVNFTSIIEKCIDQVRNIEGLKKVNIDYKVEDDLSYLGDPFLVDLIFFNMIQNAIKFQEENNVEPVKIEVNHEKENVIIHFVDHGIGIEDEDTEHIFHLYSKSAIRHQTFGLGLYLVKQCVQKLGGEIMLVNDEDLTHFR